MLTNAHALTDTHAD